MRCLAALLVGFLAVACDAPPERVAAHARAPGPALPGEVSSSPPPLPGTIDACAIALGERTPDEVRATLDDLSYDTVFRDACIAARAEADRNASACDDLSVTVLRDRCRERVAIAAGQADSCPPARAGEGREPLCLALARRDARLCAAAGTLDRAVCEAVLVDGDAHPGRSCGHLPVDLRPACIARSERLAVLATGARVDAEPVTPSLTFTLGETPERSVASVDRGARLVYDTCIPMLIVGEARVPGLSLHGPGSVLLRVPLGGEAPIEIEIGPLTASLELSADTLRGAHAESGHVSITQLERELGGTVTGTFEGELRGGASPPQVQGAFTTFLRDLEPRPAGCPSP